MVVICFSFNTTVYGCHRCLLSGIISIRETLGQQQGLENVKGIEVSSKWGKFLFGVNYPSKESRPLTKQLGFSPCRRDSALPNTFLSEMLAPLLVG